MAATKKPKVSPLEAAENELLRKIEREDAWKIATGVGLKSGTHNGYVRVEHRAAQRSVERLQMKILLLKGIKQAPTSADRAEVRVIAIKLSKIGKFKGDPQEAYQRAREKDLGSEWLAACVLKCPAALAKLWEQGIKSPEVQSAIRAAGVRRKLYAD